MSSKQMIQLNIFSLNKKSEIKKKYTIMLDYISLIKILSCFSVVILHTNGAFWRFNYSISKKYWISANYIECIFYFGFPCFILSIGATLLNFNEKYGLIEYYKRRIIKIIIPLITWNIIIYFYRVYIIRNLKREKITFPYLWNLYFKNKINSIFWSFHSFIIIYMIIPLVAYVEKTKKIKIYSYCLLILFINQIMIPYLIKIFNLNLEWIYNIKISYSIYIFAGYLIQNYDFKTKYKIIIYIFGLFGLLIHIFGTKKLTLKYKRIKRTHKGYLNAPSIIYSSAIFLFIKEYSNLFFKLLNKKYINKIGSLTIGPFFMHIPIKYIYDKYFKPNTLTVKYRLLCGIYICIICLIITFIFKKSKYLKYLVP